MPSSEIVDDQRGKNKVPGKRGKEGQLQSTKKYGQACSVRSENHRLISEAALTASGSQGVIQHGIGEG